MDINTVIFSNDQPNENDDPSSHILQVRGLMLLCSPVSYPIAKLLDWILPHDTHVLFRRKELKALVDIHGELRRRK